jgi:hypothetical protein
MNCDPSLLSPLCFAVVARAGVADQFVIDSCGTGGGSSNWYLPGGFRRAALHLLLCCRSPISHHQRPRSAASALPFIVLANKSGPFMHSLPVTCAATTKATLLMAA